MTSLVGSVLACSSVVTGDVVLEPRAKRHRSAAVVAAASLASEKVVVSLDDCPASEYTLFGTPEATESGGSPVASVCDEDASTYDEFEGPCSAIVQKVTMTSAQKPASYWQDRDYPSPTQMWGGDEIANYSDPRADRLRDLAVEQEHPGGANVFSSVCGVCGDGVDMEISPTKAFQQLSLEHRLPQSAVGDPKALVPPVRCLRGIHVQRPWARMLLEGVKTIEVRSYPLNSDLNEDLWLIETAGSRRKGDPFKTQIIGVIRFGSQVRYNTDKQFEADVREHRQEPRKWLEMAWKKLPTSVYGWRVASVQTLQEPQDPPAIKGVIGCKAVSRVAL